MPSGADTRRREIELARIGLAVGDQRRKRLDLQLRRHHQHVRRRADQRNRRQILEHVVRHLLVQHRVGDDRRVDQYQVVAVGCRVRDRIYADDAARARPVVDDDRLAEHRSELLRQHASGKIDNAPGLIGDHKMNRPRRIIRGARRRRGGAGDGETEHEIDDVAQAVHSGFSLSAYVTGWRLRDLRIATVCAMCSGQRRGMPGNVAKCRAVRLRRTSTALRLSMSSGVCRCYQPRALLRSKPPLDHICLRRASAAMRRNASAISALPPAGAP